MGVSLLHSSMRDIKDCLERRLFGNSANAVTTSSCPIPDIRSHRSTSRILRICCARGLTRMVCVLPRPLCGGESGTTVPQRNRHDAGSFSPAHEFSGERPDLGSRTCRAQAAKRQSEWPSLYLLFSWPNTTQEKVSSLRTMTNVFALKLRTAPKPFSRAKREPPCHKSRNQRSRNEH